MSFSGVAGVRLGRSRGTESTTPPVSIIAMVDELIARAYAHGASDIHLHPTADSLRIRTRIDGILEDTSLIPLLQHAELVSRIKVLAGLRTDEHQAAQDGRMSCTIEGKRIDIRVSIVPTYYGETVVMRLLGSQAATACSLDDIGLRATDQAQVLAALRRPGGMILSTGPTGSGKTTTLYTLLQTLNAPEVSIVTIEDPIEYAIDGVKQIQVNPRTGLTFATGLRSIVRQDPNIIMVGEIRDTETAGIAVNTALTGHLVLSTLHTNDAATAIPRLRDMGIDAYLIASTVSVVIGQRLARRLCPHCKEEVRLQEGRTYTSRGCAQCRASGYAGRVCLNEVLVVTDAMRDQIMRGASAAELKKTALQEGMVGMIEDGFSKVHAGHTTREEVLRVTYA